MYLLTIDYLIETFVGETFTISFDIRDVLLNKEDIDNGTFILSVYSANVDFVLIKKELSTTYEDFDGTLTYNFDSVDTKELAPQTYFYDIKLVSKDQTKQYTIISSRKFILR